MSLQNVLKHVECHLRIPVKLNSDSESVNTISGKYADRGFFEQKLSFEGRHLFDSLNKPAAKRKRQLWIQDVGTGRFI